MKRILFLSLALLLLIGLFGCSAAPNPILGTWTGEIDDSSRINQLLTDAYGDEMAQYWKVDEFKITIVMTFREDGTYDQAVDQEKLNDSMEQLRQVLHTGLTAFLQDLIAASNSTMTVEELMQDLNISVEDLLDTAFSAESIGQVEEEYTYQGHFKAEDGKLYTSVSLDYQIDENWYETYEIKDNTLTLLSLICTEDGLSADQDRYPLTLTRTE